ncbi:hypothetical protein RCH10_004720 [Variovorax sp. GrIS 2.14]|uniref:hypothetical protein n=1 Tax=Variovorax sp. GrIS 2.14 TaxID=3071709 RepID=UPI0038F7F73C
MISKRGWVPLLITVVALVGAVAYRMELWGLLKSIPAVGWAAAFGAVIAAVISVAGVVASNHSSMTRLREQHAFDRDENIAQRQHDAHEAVRARDHDAALNAANHKAEIRRAVYIEAIEGTLTTLAYIGGLFMRTPTFDGLDEKVNLDFLKASAKVWLVAETDAALHAREMTGLMTEALVSAMIRAAPLRQSLAAIRNIEERTAHALTEVRRIETKIADTSVPAASTGEIEALHQSLRVAADWLLSLRQTLARMEAERGPKIPTYMRITMNELKPVQEGLVKMVSLLRSEIHLAGNHAEFAAQLVRIELQARAMLNRVFGFGPDHLERL